MYRSRNRLLAALLLLLAAPVCLAERADRDKPVHLEADQVLIDDAQQTSTFTGNVQFTQGTLLIRGEKIVVVEDKDGYKLGTAYGHPASYRQKREGLDEYIDGYGERIVYDTRAETVDFYVQARVVRNLDDVRGQHITYSQKTEIFQVHSTDPSTATTPPKRVRAVLQPKPKEGAASQPAATDTLPIAPSETFTPSE
jgi:lipopolysaccharide export system protein LptA